MTSNQRIRVLSMKPDRNPPPWVKGDQRYIYKMVVEFLSEKKLFHKVDQILVTALAFSFSMWTDLAQQVMDEGIEQKYPNGAIGPSIAHKAMSKELDNILKLSAKIGLSPADRAKLTKSNDDSDKAQDPLQALLASRTKSMKIA